MTTKHTPGPWKVAKHDHGIVVCTESDNKTKFGASRYAAIGGFDRQNPDQLSEALANARLIAAAPELLAALNEIAAWGEGEVGNHMDEPHSAKVARAAIAKATGGAA